MINVEQMLTPAPEDAARFVKAPEVEELKIGNQVRVTDTSMPRYLPSRGQGEGRGGCSWQGCGGADASQAETSGGGACQAAAQVQSNTKTSRRCSGCRGFCGCCCCGSQAEPLSGGSA